MNDNTTAKVYDTVVIKVLYSGSGAIALFFWALCFSPGRIWWQRSSAVCPSWTDFATESPKAHLLISTNNYARNDQSGGNKITTFVKIMFVSRLVS
jgi:hypothetical protein